MSTGRAASNSVAARSTSDRPTSTRPSGPTTAARVRTIGCAWWAAWAAFCTLMPPHLAPVPVPVPRCPGLVRRGIGPAAGTRWRQPIPRFDYVPGDEVVIFWNLLAPLPGGDRQLIRSGASAIRPWVPRSY